MKFAVILCLYFFPFYELGSSADDTTTSFLTSLSVTEPFHNIKTSSDLISSVGVDIDDANSTVLFSTTEMSNVKTLSTPKEIINTSIIEITNNFFKTSTDFTLFSTETSSALPSIANTETTAVELTKEKNAVGFLDNLSEQIRNIILHFQSPDPIGFPWKTILPDPLPAPNTTQDLGFFTGHFYDISVHGLSNFSIESVNTLLDQMETYVQIQMKHVFVTGNCIIENVFITTKGPFNITLNNVTAEGTVFLTVHPDGTIRANKSVTNMNYQQLKFQLGVNGSSSLIQSVFNTAGVAVVTALHPYILQSIDERLTEEVNKELKISPKFPKISSQSPIDLAVFEARQYIRQKYEPYTIENIVNHDSEYLSINIGPAKIYGLSKFARVGDVTLGMTNGTIITKVRIITGHLNGECNFKFNFGKVGHDRNGSSKFTIQHLQFEAMIKQPTNLKKKPVLEDLQLETGRISVQLDRGGKFDYLLEMLVNLMPKMLRHFVLDALEEPIKNKIQNDILDQVNVEELIVNNLPFIESLFSNKQT